MDRCGGPTSPAVLVTTGAGLPDVLRCAVLLVDKYGPDAGIHSALQADAAVDAGDLGGTRAWCRVLAAVDELQRRTLQSGEAWR